MLPGRLGAMLSLTPKSLPAPSPMNRPGVYAGTAPRKGRVALLSGCAQTVLAPQINDATIRLLNRHGVDVIVAEGAGCCGALTHHMGRTSDSHAQAAANIAAWTAELDGEGLDAIVINASGCGTTVKDYGYMFRTDPALKDPAARVSDLTRDISEYLSEIGIAAPAGSSDLTVAYHAACSLQHGQKVTAEPKSLLEHAGYRVTQPAEAHLCCGSAGTYNMLQPELAAKLRDRKLDRLGAPAPTSSRPAISAA